MDVASTCGERKWSMCNGCRGPRAIKVSGSRVMIVSGARLMNIRNLLRGTYCLSFVLFCHENGRCEFFQKKQYQIWPTGVKTLKKVKMLQHEHTKRVKYYIDV